MEVTSFLYITVSKWRNSLFKRDMQLDLWSVYH